MTRLLLTFLLGAAVVFLIRCRDRDWDGEPQPHDPRTLALAEQSAWWH